MFQEQDSVMVCGGPYNKWVGYVRGVNTKEATVQLLLFDNEGNSIDHVCDIEDVINVEAAPELLKACQAALPVVESFYFEAYDKYTEEGRQTEIPINHKTEMDWLFRVTEQLKEAIAKTEGDEE